MQISNKCYYALKALYELASRSDHEKPVKIASIAGRQEIPKRFLEVILNELRQGGFVDSRRGVDGGYFLSRPSGKITIGEVVRFVDGDIAPVPCVSTDEKQKRCEKYLRCPFHPFWQRVQEITESVYEGTTIADILEQWNQQNARMNINYEI